MMGGYVPKGMIVMLSFPLTAIHGAVHRNLLGFTEPYWSPH
jgi:hypothetical protein